MLGWITNFFLEIVNMSLIASAVIIAVLLARMLLKKAPKIFSYALWSIVLFRLICPFSIESALSLLPIKSDPIPEIIISSNIPADISVNSGLKVFDDVINPIIHNAPPSTIKTNFNIFAILWFVGIIALILYSIISLLLLKKRLRTRIKDTDNIYMSNKIDTPFVMGLIRPKIYLPTTLSKKETAYILLHEQTHIKRFDHVIRFLSFLALCVHWFNPLVWIAFFLSGKDMEMSCDETVIKSLGTDIKKEYSFSLLALSTGKHFISGIPLAFGEGDTKGRIKNVLHYKKPTFWVGIIAVVGILIVSIGLVTNPQSYKKISSVIPELPQSFISAMQYGAITTGNESQYELSFSNKETTEIKRFLDNLQVGVTKLSSSRDDNRDMTHRIDFTYATGTYKTSVNFSLDYAEVWINNHVTPSFSYPVKSPQKVQQFFENQLGTATYPIELGSLEELWKHRTEYVGDNSAVGNLISTLVFPEDVSYNSFALHTNLEPYSITINLETDTKTSDFLTDALKRLAFERNALILFSLIENVEQLSFTLDDGKSPYSFDFYAEQIKTVIGEDYFNKTETYEGFVGVAVMIDDYITKSINELNAKFPSQQDNNNSPYDRSYMDTGDIQLTISNTTEFPEFGDTNVGFAYLEKATNQLHVGITTALGHPSPEEVEGPLGSLAGARVNFDYDIEKQEILSSEFIKGDSKENNTLDISDNRLIEIAQALLIQLNLSEYASQSVLTFWADPIDFGKVAATVWLDSLNSDTTSSQNRIASYQINNTIITSGTPHNEIYWEDMKYHYVVLVNYDITTATDDYLSVLDGLSGKSTFKGLTRELSIRMSETGSYEIVHIGTGGAESEFRSSISQSQLIEYKDIPELMKLSVSKIGKDSEVIASIPYHQVSELVEQIVFNSMITSASFDTVDLDGLDDYYRIEHKLSTKDETHTYYAFLIDGTAIIQSGTYGRNSILGIELYHQIVALFEKSNTATFQKVTFPAYQDGKTEYNAMVYDTPLFQVEAELPEGVEFYLPKKSQRTSGTLFTPVLIVQDGIKIGSIGFSIYEENWGEDSTGPSQDQYFQVAYSGVRLGSMNFWDVHTPSIKQTQTGETHTATINYKDPDEIDNHPGAMASVPMIEEHGILCYDKNRKVYIGIQFDQDTLTQEQVLELAKTVSFTGLDYIV